MFDDFLRNCKMQDEIKPSKKRVKKNVAALRSLIEKEENSMIKRKFKHKPLIIAAAVIAGISLITGAAVVIHENGFYFDKGLRPGYNYYIMITENAEGAPETIEKICYDYNFPAKYKEFSNDGVENKEVCTRYYDSEAEAGTHPYLFIFQTTKHSFTQPVVVGEDVWEPTEIRGCKGFTIVHTLDLGDGRIAVSNEVIWDCGDYIHIVVGHDISMEEVMSIVDGMTEKQEEPDI